MNVRFLRLALGLFFLVAGIGLLIVRFGFPEVSAKINSPTRMLLAGLFALVLAGWNISRWYSSWVWFHTRATPIRRPLQPDPNAGPKPEVNPEFDFSKQEAEKERIQ